MGEAGVRVRLLGGLDVEGIDVAHLGSRKARRLVARLAAARGAVVATDALVETLWEDGARPAQPADQVSVLASRVRAVLGTDALLRRGNGYALRLAWLDLAALDELVDEAERRLGDRAYAAALAAAGAARKLLRGPLLPDESDADWLDADRARVERTSGRVLLIAAEAALRSGQAEQALESARQALEADDYDEAALRLLMRAAMAAGRPAIGLAAYAQVAARLREDLGVDPAAATQDLHLDLLRGTEGRPAARRVLPELPGRGPELAALQEAFEHSAAGNGVVVLVEGEPGIGKTTLLAEFTASLPRDVDVLRAAATRDGVLPLEPLLAALDQRLRLSSPAEAADILAGESEILLPLLRPAAASRPTYRDVLTSLEPSGTGAPAVLHLAAFAVFSRLCDRAPVVLVIDDAHWADASTLSWLETVAARPAGWRLLALVASRPHPARSLRASHRLTLDRLDRAAAAHIVGDARLDEIYARSGGHPLFLVELARSTTDQLPATIREAVDERSSGAPPDTIATLRAAAELGGSVDVDLLASVLGRTPMELLDDMEEGQRRHLLADAPTGYVFSHEIVREALAAALTTARRAWLHREAARVLHRRRAADPLAVANHALLGGDSALAAQALRDAAELAEARFEHSEALRLADESLALDDSISGRLMRARALLLLARYDEARAEAHEALHNGGGIQALVLAAYAAYYARDWEATVALGAEVGKHTGQDAEAELICQFLAAKALNTTGQLTLAEEGYRRAIEAAPTSRIRPQVAMWLGLLHVHRGDLSAAEGCFDVESEARRAPMPFAELYVDQVIAQADMLAGRPLDALRRAHRLKAAVEDQHAARFRGRADVYIGWVHSVLEAPAALDLLTAARETAAAAGNHEPYAQATLDLAAWHLAHNDPQAARPLIDEVGRLHAESPISNGWRVDLRGRYLYGRAAALDGDPQTAQDAAAAVLRVCEEQQVRRYAVLAQLLSAEARLLAGEPIDEAEFDSALAALPAVARPEAWRVLARFADLRGSSRLRALASTEARRLADAAGPFAEGFSQSVARQLG